jgi:CheY-like chemotaxis protein
MFSSAGGDTPDLEAVPATDRRQLVWLVEDSPLEAEVAKRALSGFDIEVFPDGPSMIERRSTHGGPSILILDGQLPGMTGLEICRFLRASVDEVTLPILMLTIQGNKATGYPRIDCSAELQAERHQGPRDDLERRSLPDAPGD